jgi:hypothetical protein
VRKLIFISLFLFGTIISLSAQRRRNVVEDTNVLKVRGVMENFSDISDGFSERIASYVESGLTHYFYCPSDDRYCNRWGWKFLYSDPDRHAIRSYRTICNDKGLDFVWTINVADSYSWTPADYDYLLNKLIVMYYNDIRSFGLRFPDHESNVDITMTLLQQDFVLKMKEPVKLYVVNEMPVIQYPSESDIAQTLMKGYHFDDTFKNKAVDTKSILCRISVNDAFSGLPIAAAMDYAKDPELYEPDRSIAEGLDSMRPDVKEAFMTFLCHTGGVDESLNVNTFSLEEWTEEKGAALYEEFRKIEKVPSILESVAGADIVEALRPWLKEFGRLGARGQKVLDCIADFYGNDIGKFWVSYVESRMTEEELLAYRCFPVGTEKLYPFIKRSMESMVEAFAERLTKGGSDGRIPIDLHTCVRSEGKIEFKIPAYANTCRLLTGRLSDDRQVLFRQLGADGRLVAEFVVKSPYTEFDLKEGAVKVDVLGEVDIYETIFVYL